MHEAEYKFVEHSKGTFEGSVYDNVVLSDGVMTAKFKNGTGESDFSFKRGDPVSIKFSLEFAKSGLRATLKEIA